MFKTTITEIGSMVPDFKEELLLILFGPKATSELKDISVIHESNETPLNVIKEGGLLTIGNQEYKIKTVGSEANKNWEDLGHISIYFRQGENEVLPGAIIVEPKNFPELSVGDIISFQ